MINFIQIHDEGNRKAGDVYILRDSNQLHSWDVDVYISRDNNQLYLWDSFAPLELWVVEQQ